jgi:aryl-alcohol dehydrogenase-like predicted oxidoreductase
VKSRGVTIERMEFGRTGHLSTRVIFGAAALGRMLQERADEVLEVLLEYGINHIDTAASYGDSELRVAPWLAEHPGRFFLATKTGERTHSGARAELERSLTRLGVDRVDLIQLHNLVEPEEWEVAHSAGGAVEGLVRARDEGLVRFIGVTGHGLRIAAVHQRSLERFDFDSVLLPYSYLLMGLPEYRADVERLLETCAERRVAVQTIKSLARRRWEGEAGPRFSWYEPITDEDALGRSVRWVLSNPHVFLNTSSDARLLRPTLESVSEGVAASSANARYDQALADDALRLEMAPLFDGSDLERI